MQGQKNGAAGFSVVTAMAGEQTEKFPAESAEKNAGISAFSAGNRMLCE